MDYYSLSADHDNLRSRNEWVCGKVEGLLKEEDGHDAKRRKTTHQHQMTQQQLRQQHIAKARVVNITTESDSDQRH